MKTSKILQKVKYIFPVTVITRSPHQISSAASVSALLCLAGYTQLIAFHTDTGHLLLLHLRRCWSLLILG